MYVCMYMYREREYIYIPTLYVYTCIHTNVCVCETRYHIRNFDITVCYDNRDWVLQTTTFNSEMQGAGVWIRSLQPTKTLLMSQWYQPGTLGWRTCNVGSNLHKLFYYLVFESFGTNRLTEFHRLQPCPIEGDLGNQATASSTLIIIKST